MPQYLQTDYGLNIHSGLNIRIIFDPPLIHYRLGAALRKPYIQKIHKGKPASRAKEKKVLMWVK